MIIASHFIAAPLLSNKDLLKDPKMTKLHTLSSSATNGPTFPDDKLKMALAYTTVTAVWPSRAMPGGEAMAVASHYHAFCTAADRAGLPVFLFRAQRAIGPCWCRATAAVGPAEQL